MKKKTRICISNMHCSNCSATVERHFNKQKDINVTVILSENEGVFTFEDSSWNEKKIEKELKKIGYPAKKDNSTNKELVKLITCAILTIPFIVNMILMMCNIHLHYPLLRYIELILATIIELLIGVPFILGMLRDFKNKRLGMDVLVSFGTLTAYIYSLVLLISNSNEMLYFETCAMLLTIISIGKFIEKKAKVKTSSALKDLMSLQETKAKVVIDDKVIEKDIEDINIDDILIIPLQSNIPLDGIVVSGNSSIDQSMLTGESLPVNIKENDKVFAGTRLVGNSVLIKVTNKVNDTYLSSLINKVEEIQAKKPRLQKLADKIASIFVPAVIFLSILCFLVTFLTSKQFDVSLKRSIAVLMISCPCSLGLATPLSILVGSSRAIKLGIIYNNTEIFEKASKINAICFDKTGTLTNGVFSVESFESSIDNALDIIYTLEVNSTHPIAKSLVSYCMENNAKLIEGLQIKEVVGKGIYANDYFINKVNRNIYLYYKDEVVASLTISDKLKDNSLKVVNLLTHKNINVYILTGDNKETALQIANELSLNESNVFYEIKPEDKLEILKSLSKDKNVAFVGDGINDALALNYANLSISMGSGADVAKSSSDITLASNDLATLNSAINLSKKVYKNIIENFIWAFSYNIIAIPLAFIGILSPLVSGLCMAFSNISVVVNALRLYKINIKEK